MIQIVPAILPEDFTSLRSSLARVRVLSPFVQIDVCDGNYVGSTTWPYGEPDSFEPILTGEEGMPFWQDFQFEFDLMISRPEESIKDWIDAGASRVIIHNQSTDGLPRILDELDYAGVEAGIALTLDEDPGLVGEYIEKIAFVQCMGIAKIGEQGNPFDSRALAFIKELRDSFPNLPISVDGGVSEKTIQELIQVGATRLVSGSAILKAEDPKRAYEAMVALAGSLPNSPQA